MFQNMIKKCEKQHKKKYSYKGVSPNLFLAFICGSDEPNVSARAHSNDPAIADQCKHIFISCVWERKINLIRKQCILYLIFQ